MVACIKALQAAAVDCAVTAHPYDSQEYYEVDAETGQEATIKAGAAEHASLL